MLNILNMMNILNMLNILSMLKNQFAAYSQHVESFQHAEYSQHTQRSFFSYNDLGIYSYFIFLQVQAAFDLMQISQLMPAQCFQV